MPSPPRFAEVAVRSGAGRLFHYAVPPGLAVRIRLGQRVSVPFGPRLLQGTVVGFPDTPEVATQKLRPIAGIADPEPLCSAHLLELTRWIADTYACSWSEAIEAAVPAGAKRGRAAREVLVARLAVTPEAARAEADLQRPRAPRRARLLEILAQTGEALAPDLLRQARAPREALSALARAGLVRLASERAPEDPVLAAPPAPHEAPQTPTEEQAEAIRAIFEARTGGAFLLFGITGSGKTEVYLQAIAEAVARGRQAILLVPEIALTPQTVGRFRARFGAVAVLHSRLTDGQRHDQWTRIRSGEARVVVGARSAVFAPAEDLGLIVVDEEHESSFKQQSKPRYHARDAALARGRLLGIPVVLGSATPSLESWEAAREGRLRLLRLTRRHGGGSLPPVSVVDLRHETGGGKGRPRHLSAPLLDAVSDAVRRGGQAMLLLNRRGFATVVCCKRCGWALSCAHCDVTLTWHKGDGRARCHTCDHSAAPPPACPECGAPGLLFRGFGTERVEEELRAALPSARLLRMDADTTRGRLSHERILGAFSAGEADILLGTQMIAKGLDFPRVTVVGVISADTALSLPDFRAAERTFQLMAQVSGRAGRGPEGGRVVVQTYRPDHPAVRHAATHDFEAFALGELEHRRALGYPPYGHLARILVQARDPEAAERHARRVGDILRAAAREGEVLGPAPCPVARVEGWHRQHLLVKAPSPERRGALLAAAGAALRASGRSLRVWADVDPTDLM